MAKPVVRRSVAEIIAKHRRPIPMHKLPPRDLEEMHALIDGNVSAIEVFRFLRDDCGHGNGVALNTVKEYATKRRGHPR